MNIIEWSQVVIAGITLLTFLVTLFNNFKLVRVHKDTNGMKDQLIREVRVASVAKGRKLEKKFLTRKR